MLSVANIPKKTPKSLLHKYLGEEHPTRFTPFHFKVDTNRQQGLGGTMTIRDFQQINYPILWGGHPARPVYRTG
ncbi:hypothetical protein NIES4073_17410 [Kalymmatonema gypsitolerans NIES-4073]|nr:hypothetical protein NIES4073_17410 [Scytonema sp. NIES-4073]